MSEQHCAGYSAFKDLSSVMLKCPHCGKEKEVFTDELKKPQVCKACGKEIDVEKAEKREV